MKLLTDKDINEALLKIIEEAGESLVIVSPFIKLDNLQDDWKKIREKLEEKSKIVEIHTRPEYYDKGTKKNTEEEIYKIFKGINPDNIYYNRILHAKLYFNEKEALITSSNLLTHSIERNIEIGYLIDDKNECENIKKQFYEKYLIEPNKYVKDNIGKIKELLNKEYDHLEYDHEKIIIENKNKSGTVFKIQCFYTFLEKYNYSLGFKIIINDENNYSQIIQKFSKQFGDYRDDIQGYKEDKENKTISFSLAIIIHSHDPLVFADDDIRNVFCIKKLFDIFYNYIKHITITLRDILFHKE
jgi:phosphatidylserine/phosphatidylglycerophosphate/cardiolipin synthase-like enzyme